jgi:hypothetical protein
MKLQITVRRLNANEDHPLSAATTFRRESYPVAVNDVVNSYSRDEFADIRNLHF